MKHTIHLPTAYCSYLSGIVLTILFPVIPDEMSIRVIGVFSALLIMAGFLPAIAGVKVSRITVPAALNGGSGFRRFFERLCPIQGFCAGCQLFLQWFFSADPFLSGIGVDGNLYRVFTR